MLFNLSTCCSSVCVLRTITLLLCYYRTDANHNHYFMQQQKNHIEILPAQINSIMLHVYLSLNYRQIKRYITKIHVPHNYRYPKSTFTFETGLFTPFLD